MKAVEPVQYDLQPGDNSITRVHNAIVISLILILEYTNVVMWSIISNDLTQHDVAGLLNIVQSLKCGLAKWIVRNGMISMGFKYLGQFFGDWDKL